LIREIRIGAPVDDNADVIVILVDGHGYAFTAFTPRGIEKQMTREQMAHFYVEDLLIVRDFHEATVRAALEDIASRDRLDPGGIRQSE